MSKLHRREANRPASLRREILPNIAPIILADVGIRFGYSIILIASVNYLGLGLAPPAADWGLMISENQQYIVVNLWAVLAPAIMLALLTIGVNLVADAYVDTLGRSGTAVPKSRRWRAARAKRRSRRPRGWRGHSRALSRGIKRTSNRWCIENRTRQRASRPPRDRRGPPCTDTLRCADR